MNALILPFTFPVMADAAMIAVIVAIPAALLSCFLVLKGWALIGDGISHAVLPGIVLAYAMGLPLLIGAFIAGMICALASGWLDANSRIKPDTALGVVMAGMFAVGLILFTVFPPGCIWTTSCSATSWGSAPAISRRPCRSRWPSRSSCC